MFRYCLLKISLLYIFGLLVRISAEDNKGDVLYKEFPQFRGTMCKTSHTVFNEASSVSVLDCARKCSRHHGCSNIFYHEKAGLCVGCALLYSNANDADISDRDTLHYRGVCGVFLVSGRYGIPDSMITVTSQWSEAGDPELHGPKYSRLNTILTVPGSGAWNAGTDNPGEYIQAEFYNVKLLTGIATQGRPDNPYYHQYVTEYEVHYSLDCNTFTPVMTPANVTQTFPGNFDRNTIVTNSMAKPVYARCVRIYPTEHNNWVTIRFDLLGCV